VNSLLRSTCGTIAEAVIRLGIIHNRGFLNFKSDILMVTKPKPVPQAGCLVCMEKMIKIFYTFVKNLNEEDQSHGKIILKLI